MFSSNSKNTVIYSAMLATVFFAFGTAGIDPDYGWHLQSGRYYRTHGIPETDIFSYTATDYPWINHEWLNEVLVSYLHDAGGRRLPLALFSLLWAGAIILASRTYHPLILALSAIVFLPYIGTRPSAWTVLFFVIFERLIRMSRLRHQYKWPYIAIILLCMLWANLHGGFIIGLAILIFYALQQRRMELAGAAVLGFAATYINPYRLRLYDEVFRTITSSHLRAYIIEWNNIFTVVNITTVVYFAVIVTIAIVGKGGLKVRPLSFAQVKYQMFKLPLYTFILALSSVRHIPLFVVSYQRYAEKNLRAAIKKIPQLSILIAGIVLSIGGYVFIIRSARANIYPSQAVAYLQENKCPGNLFNSYGYGGYLIWKLPNQPVYIDGRMVTWIDKGENYFQDYLQFHTDKEFRSAQIEKFNIKCALLYKESHISHELIAQLQNERFSKVLEDQHSILLIKY